MWVLRNVNVNVLRHPLPGSMKLPSRHAWLVLSQDPRWLPYRLLGTFSAFFYSTSLQSLDASAFRWLNSDTPRLFCISRYHIRIAGIVFGKKYGTCETCLYFSSLWNHSPGLPVVQYLKRVVPNVKFSNFYLLLYEKLGLILDIPSTGSRSTGVCFRWSQCICFKMFSLNCSFLLHTFSEYRIYPMFLLHWTRWSNVWYSLYSITAVNYISWLLNGNPRSHCWKNPTSCYIVLFRFCYIWVTNILLRVFHLSLRNLPVISLSCKALVRFWKHGYVDLIN